MGKSGADALMVTGPWEIFGAYKHVVLIFPMMLKVAHSNVILGEDLHGNTLFHLLLASALRYLHIQLWMTTTRFHGLIKKHKVQKECRSFEQKDKEVHWDNAIILQLLMAVCMISSHTPGLSKLPLWNGKGIICLFLLHAGPTEYIYYWCHRMLHESGTWYKSIHSLHHTTSVPEPTSGFFLTFVEHMAFTALVSIPFLGAGFLGVASVGMFYCYWLFLDVVSAVGHCNWEFVPNWIFKMFPPLKYLLLTPTYHSLHHKGLEHNSNYALSIPLYDYLGGTFNTTTYHEHSLVRQGRQEMVPHHVFLVHEVGLDSVLHLNMGLVGFHSIPFRHRWYVTLFMPITVPIMLAMWAFATPFHACEILFDDFWSETWVVPRFGFQYFIGIGRDNINKLIEDAIVEADKMGTRVLTLGALNKMEELNEGGLLFLKRQPNLQMRLCHGNTLTAGVILNGLPIEVEEIFLTGATSKLGRAVSIYLATHGVRVLMLTTSASRVEVIVKECPEEYRHNLVHVTTYQDAQHCKTWVLGKGASPKDQRWAPPGTKMHQFVVPMVSEVRKDCTYGHLAAMRLPKEAKGSDSCEHALDRGVVHACHAGGLLHTMKGWTHHEMGPIPVDRVETVWKAAMEHGFRPVDAEGGFLDWNISHAQNPQKLVAGVH
ncbi:hypothetical protein KC19_11G054100 [Ceratodon purpureus]|uniref:Uncharacterized protein n=1 Tax=Ceratodon purpureus TaxID=3225 RepID=A0A8T0GE92_CERPU|nr:hypothetical protein KC19_11G054100 [Ceratodon purpureus]